MNCPMARRICIGAFITLMGIGDIGHADLFADGPVTLPDGTEIRTVDFERHIAALFSRLGCNAAACHGSFQGQGGFRLSLFGQSPALDYASIVGDAKSSRVDLKFPDKSTLLIKPSSAEEHGGGLKLPADSWEFQLIRSWISSGADRVPGHGAVKALQIQPTEIPALKIGQTLGIRVFALFENGDRQDVTAFSELCVRDETIAQIDTAGKLLAQAAGDTAVIVSYRGMFVGREIIVLHESVGSTAKSFAANNWIDDEVNARLVRLNLIPSPVASDAQFLRRVYLDVAGTLPAPVQVQQFLASTDPQKRAMLVDDLLSHPRRAALWATKMCDILVCSIEQLGTTDELNSKRSKMWHDWLRKRFSENMPYDQLVHGILCATSRQNQSVSDWIDNEIQLETSARSGFETNYQDRPSLDYFWRRFGTQDPLPVEDLAELSGAAFLGIRLHCARCHQHPYDQWTQADFAGFASVFARVDFGSSPELSAGINKRLERRRRAKQDGTSLPAIPRIQEVFLNSTPRPLVDSWINEPVLPKAPGGPVLTGDDDPRESLFRWLTQPDNPYFAANFVNRIWAKYFGTGLVEPVDQFSVANPATHPRLLQRLSAEFVASGYDIRHIERLILKSAAYQRSSEPAGNNASDRRNFAHANVRPLMAEVLIDSLNTVLESTEDFGQDVPRGSQAIELAPNRFADPYVNELFRVLGRGDRRSFCDCGRAASPSVRQTLYLMSDTKVMEKLPRGRLSRLMEQKTPDRDIVIEFYLAALSRNPDADELDFVLKQLASDTDRVNGLTDLLWALINSNEFCTNH